MSSENKLLGVDIPAPKHHIGNKVFVACRPEHMIDDSELPIIEGYIVDIKLSAQVIRDLDNNVVVDTSYEYSVCAGFDDLTREEDLLFDTQEACEKQVRVYIEERCTTLSTKMSQMASLLNKIDGTCPEDGDASPDEVKES